MFLRVASLLCVVVFAHAVPAIGAERRAERTTPPRAVTLDAPRHLTVLDYTPRVVIGWTYDGSLTTGFEIERAVISGGTTVRPDQFARVGAPGRDARTFRDPTSHGRMTYVYRIRAVGTGTMSPWSKDLIVRVHPRRTPAPRLPLSTGEPHASSAIVRNRRPRRGRCAWRVTPV